MSFHGQEKMHLKSQEEAQFHGMPWGVRPFDACSPQPCNLGANTAPIDSVSTHPSMGSLTPELTSCYRTRLSDSQKPLTQMCPFPHHLLKPIRTVLMMCLFGISCNITTSYSFYKLKSPRTQFITMQILLSPEECFISWQILS